MRERGSGHVWGRVRNENGKTIVGRVRTPEVYGFTADATLVCLDAILSGEAPVGYQTPAAAFGSELVLRCRGTELSVDGQAIRGSR